MRMSTAPRGVGWRGSEQAAARVTTSAAHTLGQRVACRLSGSGARPVAAEWDNGSDTVRFKSGGGERKRFALGVGRGMGHHGGLPASGAQAVGDDRDPLALGTEVGRLFEDALLRGQAGRPDGRLGCEEPSNHRLRTVVTRSHWPAHLACAQRRKRTLAAGESFSST